MAFNLEKVSSVTAEDRAARIAKSACKKEACAIQACLQGINHHTSFCALKVFSVIILNHAHQSNIILCISVYHVPH